MRYRFAISPDVHARDLPTWFVLNTRLQRALGRPGRATVHDDFGALHRACAAGEVDLVYANAADTVELVREHGFLPVVRPREVADEAVVVVSATGPVTDLDDVPDRLTVAATDAPDVERICRILLEPADLDAGAIDLTVLRNYVLVAKAVITGQVEAGFFLRRAHDNLSATTRGMLRPLISSRIHVVSHCLLLAPGLAELREPLRDFLHTLSRDPAEQSTLAELGAPHGWQPANEDDVEFMVDLMDALKQ